MADTPRTWLTLGDFKTCLEQIQVANGFHTDAGAHVSLEPSQIPEDQGALIAVVLEGLLKAAEPAVARTHRLATVVLVAKVSTAANNAQLRLHQLVHDIETAMKGQQKAFGAGRASPTFVSALALAPDPGVKWIGAEVRYTTHVLIG